MRYPAIFASICLAYALTAAVPANLEAGCGNPNCATCSTQSACGCSTCSKSKSKGLLSAADKLVSKLFSFKKKKSQCSSAPSCGCETVPSCDCPSEPSCGCEVEPTCGCEIEPSCGCEMEPSCGCSTTYSPNTGAINRYVPQQSMPEVKPAVPAPTPLPDAELDPFMDDAVNRIRKVPARRINYQVPKKLPYGNRYDPQASNGVRVQLRDSNTGAPTRIEPARVEKNEVVTASASLLRKVMSKKAKRLPQKPEPMNYFNPLRP